MITNIPAHESLTVEFKSDRSKLRDSDLVSIVMCLANTEGGQLYLGVEDDGTPTGLHGDHSDLPGMAALIANRTRPPVNVQVTLCEVAGHTLAQIDVPKTRQIVSTTDGVTQRRRIEADGKPACVPYYASEFDSRQSSLGLIDPSDRAILEASEADFDPLEIERLRQMLDRYSTDYGLVELTNGELLAALRLVQRVGDRRVPTVTGLLLLGREAALRQHLPTHEIGFQVRDDTKVRVNTINREPLLRAFERIREQFEARVEESEVQVGFIRVPVPNYDYNAFREALINAVTHRDYTLLGTVLVRMETDGLIISNPGGFVEGVTLTNLLVVEPKPRNPVLADAMKRIGLAERTGRGVDVIYASLLRYGRPPPDYSRSTANSVVVYIENVAPDLPFYTMVLEEERRSGKRMPLDSLIVLNLLRKERRTDVQTAATTMQKSISSARSVLERLVEAGLVEAHGATRERFYMLSARVYRLFGQPTAYTRQAGSESAHCEERILQHLAQHGQVTRKTAAELCHLSADQASYLLRSLRDAGKIKAVGKLAGTYYTIIPQEEIR
ncbi:MAG: putative DNA binding domain-containing protein [Chloroflexota bacterium]|nr:putative DNA binding domain-containing protein [Chloroflexota bacterium]